MQRTQSLGAGLGTRQLPREILYFIVEVSAFEARTSLVRCNRWFHAACMPLLFRDVHLRTPNQLVKFYENEKTASMLDGTWSLSLSDSLFYRWNHQSPDQEKSSYIISILSATTSLLRLQIFQGDSHTEKIDIPGLYEKLCSLGSDPAFLPRLEAIAGTGDLPLDLLCSNRPVKYLIKLIDNTMRVELYPGYNELSSVLPLPRPTPSRPTHGISPGEVGMFIRESKRNSLVQLKPSFVTFIIRHDQGNRHETCLSTIDDFATWIREMVLAANFAPDGPLILTFASELEPPFLSTQKQFEVVKELHTIIPRLVEATIFHPTIRWCIRPTYANLHRRTDGPLSTWPIWTPAPNSRKTDLEVLQWWLDMLQINSSRPQTYDAARHNAVAMGEVMLRYSHELPAWYREKLPPEYLIIRYLQGRN